MSDIGIFIFGCCVFGVALTSTMFFVIGPSQPETPVDESLEDALDDSRQLSATN